MVFNVIKNWENKGMRQTQGEGCNSLMFRPFGVYIKGFNPKFLSKLTTEFRLFTKTFNNNELEVRKVVIGLRKMNSDGFLLVFRVVLNGRPMIGHSEAKNGACFSNILYPTF